MTAEVSLRKLYLAAIESALLLYLAILLDLEDLLESCSVINKDVLRKKYCSVTFFVDGRSAGSFGLACWSHASSLATAPEVSDAAHPSRDQMMIPDHIYLRPHSRRCLLWFWYSWSAVEHCVP